MRPFTDNDWNTLPHITVMSPKDWNPASLDSIRDKTKIWSCYGKVSSRNWEILNRTSKTMRMKTKPTKSIIQSIVKASRCFYLS